jgi:hypothetical protein
MIPFCMINNPIPTSTPYQLSGFLHYDFSATTSTTFVDNKNTVVDSLYTRAYNFGTFSQGNLTRESFYVAKYEYSTEVNQSIVSLSASNYGLATQSISSPFGLTESFTFFAIVRTGATATTNDKFFEAYDANRNISLYWNASSESSTLGLNVGISPTATASTYRSVSVSPSTWYLVKATGSYANGSTSLYLNVSGVTSSGGNGPGFGVGATSVSILTSVSTTSTIKVGEVFFTKSVMNSSELSEAENYLKNKWNLSY